MNIFRSISEKSFVAGALPPGMLLVKLDLTGVEVCRVHPSELLGPIIMASSLGAMKSPETIFGLHIRLDS